MDNKIRNTFRMGIIAAAGAAAMLSCTDTWDDHYGSTLVTDYAGTTMQAIEENAPDFAAVIKAVGYDRELSSDNVYTIWAPESFNLDSVLQVAEKDSAAVVDQFIKNHLARYSVSAVPGEESKVISLMSMKNATMVGDETFSTAKILSPNLSCANGVLHVIDTNIPYQFNIFEIIKSLDTAGADETSLYSFLQKWDADSLDEERSVSHGVDEDGNKIWVSPFYIRNNTVLKNVDALVYSEDSDYIAIIPSAEAYKARYEIAKGLLNFNPMQADRDSLQNYYANMFAMTDLFFNRNANLDGLTPDGDGLQYDSLKSTNFSYRTWPNNIYYSKAPAKGLHPDKDVNDILAKCGEPIECSNGVAYSVDKYPMSVTEQFFKKLEVVATNNSIDRSENSKFTTQVASALYSAGTIHDYAVDTVWVDEEKTEYERIDSTYIGERGYHFCDISPNGNNSPTVAFQVPNTLSGTYELYVVTCPIWAKYGFDGYSPKDNPKPYHFQVNLYERDAQNNYGSAKLIAPPAESLHDGNYFITDYTNKIDTLYLGEYTFKNAYHSLDTEGVLIQFYNYVRNSETSVYSREMLISSIILRPKFEAKEEDVVTEAKR